MSNFPYREGADELQIIPPAHSLPDSLEQCFSSAEFLAEDKRLEVISI